MAAAWCCRMACCTVVIEVAEAAETVGCWMCIGCSAAGGGGGAGARLAAAAKLAAAAAAAAAAEGKLFTCLANSCC